jgi:hypothetical protein
VRKKKERTIAGLSHTLTQQKQKERKCLADT